MIRQLFSGLETTLHERLALIEQVLNTIEKPKVALYDNEFVKRIERLEHQQKHSSATDMEARMSALERGGGSTRYMEERISALEEQLAATCAELEELRRRPVVAPKEPILPDEDAEAEVLDDEEAEVEEEEEVEVEEEGLALEPFTHKGTVYYKDPDNNVYMTDEDGALGDEPVARWNGVSGAGSKLLRLNGVT